MANYLILIESPVLYYFSNLLFFLRLDSPEKAGVRSSILRLGTIIYAHGQILLCRLTSPASY